MFLQGGTFKSLRQIKAADNFPVPLQTDKDSNHVKDKIPENKMMSV